MKKILILSYYFPPCNLTPSERVHSYALYLHEMGYYPVVVTRNWDIPISGSKDEHKRTGNTIMHEKNEKYEVYYLPFKPTLKDKLFEKFSGTHFYFLYLLTTVIYTIGENFSSEFTALKPLYRQTEKIVSIDKDIKLILISGSPFHLFKFGYKLKKKFGLKWIADYRDDWTTNELVRISRIKNFLQKITAFSEKKWVGSAEFFLSVSDHFVKKIHRFLGKVPGHTILNGYLEQNYSGLEKKVNDCFTIAYAGSLYPNQPIEIFISGYKKFIDSFPSIKSKVVFIGLKGEPQSLETVEKLVKGYEPRFEYTFRLPKKEAIEIQYNATVLLACAYSGLKGIPGSKLYEYVALQKPVLVCPSDAEIIEDTLRETGQGYFANTPEECCSLLKQLYLEYGYEFSTAKQIDAVAVKKYSRYENVKKLAGLMAAIKN